MKLIENLKKSVNYDPKKRDVYFIIASSPVLLLIYRYFGEAKNYQTYFSKLGISNVVNVEPDWHNYLLQFITFFILMMVVPLVYNAFFLRMPLKALGFSAGKIKTGFWITTICLIAIVPPATIIAGTSPELMEFYPLYRGLFTQPELVLVYEISWIVFYFIAWEFYFRGFMLFGLEKELGAVVAIGIQTMASSLVHLGTPSDEASASVLAGFGFGYLAIVTRSFWYPFILHTTIAIAKDLYILHTWKS
jgi:membrane protease YdiL (CAAX protease family)